jgi:hypothetical protein
VLDTTDVSLGYGPSARFLCVIRASRSTSHYDFTVITERLASHR